MKIRVKTLNTKFDVEAGGRQGMLQEFRDKAVAQMEKGEPPFCPHVFLSSEQARQLASILQAVAAEDVVYHYEPVFLSIIPSKGDTDADASARPETQDQG